MRVIKKFKKTELQSLSIGASLNKKILFLLPDQVDWHQVSLNIEDINGLKFIRDQSWEREFGKAETVGGIRKKLLFESAQGIHAGIIKNKIKNWRALSKKPFLIILTLSGSTKGPYTIIDGHHRLIAMLLKKRKTPRLNTILAVVKEDQSRTELRKLVGK